MLGRKRKERGIKGGGERYGIGGETQGFVL